MPLQHPRWTIGTAPNFDNKQQSTGGTQRQHTPIDQLPPNQALAACSEDSYLCEPPPSCGASTLHVAQSTTARLVTALLLQAKLAGLDKALLPSLCSMGDATPVP